LGNSAEVLKQILAKPDEIPQAYLNKAKCVLVFPAVRKMAVGIGGLYGRALRKASQSKFGQSNAPPPISLRYST
jgi:lipid-binding SYLF domain-containing protein